MTRQEHFDVLLARIAEARRTGDDHAREIAEYELSRLFAEMREKGPVDYKMAQAADGEDAR